jgi:hypothetical protein
MTGIENMFEELNYKDNLGSIVTADGTELKAVAIGSVRIDSGSRCIKLSEVL